MLAALASSWKFLLTAGLLLAICGSVLLRAPRAPIERRDLRRLIVAAVALYAVGAAATLSHRGMLAGFVYASGILVCSIAVWLSRGSGHGDDGEGPGEDEPPVDGGPSPGPDGLPLFDWDEFERELAGLTSREPSVR